MSSLRQACEDYLRIRRALGFKLERAGELLPRFLDYLESVGADTITTEHALRWATLPSTAKPVYWQLRLTVVRGFARYLQTIDPAAELPPTGLLPACGGRRPTPYIYSDAEIAALIAAAGGWRSRLGRPTLQALIGLLAVTGMRIGEAIRLDRGDLDLEHRRLVVRNSKFGKSRQLSAALDDDRGAARLPGPARSAAPPRRSASAADHRDRQTAGPPIRRVAVRPAPQACRADPTARVPPCPTT